MVVNIVTLFKMNYTSTRCQIVSFSFILLLAIGFFLAVYMCAGRECLSTNYLPTADFEAFMNGRLIPHQFSDSDLIKQRTMDFEGEDVLVYLHIQKTGGSSFGQSLVHNLDFKPPCKCIANVKKCECFTQNNRIWLLSRHSTGWVCGLHADWTELNDCVDEWFIKNDVASRTHRRYHYISFIRNPVDRFFSEWQHVSRGATWVASRLHCNGRIATVEEVPFCFTTEDWRGVSFEEFILCRHNLAFNRMTRMLADMSKVNCYNNSHLDQKEVEETMINSAKENLLSFDFFGLLENQKATQFLFERTFGIQFINNFAQRKRTHIHRITITPQMRARVIETNKMDIYLYQFAKDLFLQRVKAMEKYLGYTVDEYFDHVRIGDDAVQPDIKELFEFEDDTTADIEVKAADSYPSRSIRRH